MQEKHLFGWKQKKKRKKKINHDLIQQQIRGFLFKFYHDAFKTFLPPTDNKTEAVTDTLSGYVTLTCVAYTTSHNIPKLLREFKGPEQNCIWRWKKKQANK